MTARRDAGPRKDATTGTWWFVVDIGSDASGKRRQAKRRGFRTKDDAQKALDALRGSVTTQTFVAPAKQTVAEFFDEWLETVRGTLEPSTWSSYRRNVRLHVKAHIGNIKLQSLDAAALNRLYGQLREHLSVRTVRYVHTIIHRALKDAVKWGRLVRNPADASDPPRAKDARAPEMRTWTATELGRFLETMQGSRYRAPWVTIATTGMRRGEVLGLRWRDIDLDAGRLSIRQTITTVDYKILIAPRTKTGRGRAIDLDATTVAELRANRARQAQEFLLLGTRPDGDTLAFCLPDGRPYHPAHFSREFDRAVARIRKADLAANIEEVLPRIRLHDLRHTWATLALAAGVPIKIVSERLGHATSAITSDVYSHVTPTMQADAAEKVADLIFGA